MFQLAAPEETPNPENLRNPTAEVFQLWAPNRRPADVLQPATPEDPSTPKKKKKKTPTADVFQLWAPNRRPADVFQLATPVDLPKKKNHG